MFVNLNSRKSIGKKSIFKNGMEWNGMLQIFAIVYVFLIAKIYNFYFLILILLENGSRRKNKKRRLFLQ